jgi:hypothetical protein
MKKLIVSAAIVLGVFQLCTPILNANEALQTVNMQENIQKLN